MKKIQIYISFIIIVLITVTSVIQYHHHDNEGRMCMYTSLGNNISHENNSNGSHHYCNGHKHHNDSNDDSNCSAKLSQVNSPKKLNIKNTIPTFTVFINIVKYILQIPDQEITTLEVPYLKPLISPTFHKVHGLRAPPIL